MTNEDRLIYYLFVTQLNEKESRRSWKIGGFVLMARVDYKGITACQGYQFFTTISHWRKPEFPNQLRRQIDRGEVNWKEQWEWWEKRKRSPPWIREKLKTRGGHGLGKGKDWFAGLSVPRGKCEGKWEDTRLSTGKKETHTHNPAN